MLHFYIFSDVLASVDMRIDQYKKEATNKWYISYIVGHHNAILNTKMAKVRNSQTSASLTSVLKKEGKVEISGIQGSQSTAAVTAHTNNINTKLQFKRENTENSLYSTNSSIKKSVLITESPKYTAHDSTYSNNIIVYIYNIYI